ncbi:MAG TPA: radical SAM family heme chaperone HemW, partial [Actinomycetota bacterium]|nr:radical SAM family heme chaperone HemW [Actinomycetota bacterium]
LVEEIERVSGDFPAVTSVFFGGGTPTLLPAESLNRILAAIRKRFGLAPVAEVTAEVNPETVDERKFEALLAGGFNRFSVGVQSLSPQVLRRLGRTHSFDRALRALADARRAGVEDLNADLIYGSPWESDGDWLHSLEGVLAAGVDHVSAYALTVEKGTPLHTLVRTGRAPDVDPDIQAARHGTAEEVLAKAGFGRYEISNWCTPGRASRHNLLYWSAGDYAAFGAGAHGHASGRRYWKLRLPRDYVAAVEQGSSTDAGDEQVEDRGAEALMLGLRLSSGIDEATFARRFGRGALESRSRRIAALCDDGLLVRRDRWLAVPPGAVLLTNEVLARLL